MKNDANSIEYLLDALETPSQELTKWEENFLESITDQFRRRGTLTDAQFEKLEKIYAEKTA